ncbi:hypothetical protein BIV23_07975 [Streptomyces monashensis]|uniref:Uncharacterized protein n=1 Tax=Streptomyces monashensis TaxID=1678012 RepID=A0A1S2QKZ2_9ACTN|nr:hypothetical protein BIV23_07975 [Streptomyces monashensis]
MAGRQTLSRPFVLGFGCWRLRPHRRRDGGLHRAEAGSVLTLQGRFAWPARASRRITAYNSTLDFGGIGARCRPRPKFRGHQPNDSSTALAVCVTVCRAAARPQ